MDHFDLVPERLIGASIWRLNLEETSPYTMVLAGFANVSWFFTVTPVDVEVNPLRDMVLV